MSGVAANSVPELRSGVDVTKLALSMDEGFVLSRIDGRAGVAEIAMLVGKNTAETTRILTRLAEVGVIRFGSVEAKPVKAPPPPSAGQSEYKDFIFPASLMMEAGELDEETRKRIIYTHEHLGRWNHYELLDVEHRADPRDIKKAYFARSKEWHPDRFKRGELGSFKRLIETIYKQINEAYRVLSDDAERKAYDDTCVFDLPEEEIERLVEEKKDKEREERHDEAIKERRRANNPVRKRIEQAEQFAKQAKELAAEGRTLEALRAAQMAATYDERNKDYKELARSLKDSAGEFRIERFIKRGLRLEATLEWDEAILMYEEAVRVAPNSGRARLRLAYNMMMSGRDPQVALGHAQRAVAALPEEPEAHFVIGRLYEAAGMDKNLSKRAYEKAVALKPNYQDAQKRLKRLKWGF